MWQLLLGAAVAGSTSLLAKHLFSPNPNNPFSQQAPICENDQIPGQELQSQPVIQLQDGFTQSGLEINSEDQKKDGIFTFSSAGSSRKLGLSAGKKILRKKSLKKAERRYRGEQVGGRRFSLCLKRRRTVKNVDHKCDSCSSKGNSVFGWGLGVGIMYMMSAGKTEISRLNSSMDETVKIVQELQNELNRRKPSQTALALNSDNNVSTHCKKVGSSNVQLTLSNSSNGNSFLNNIRGRGIPVSDDGECASSVLTDEPEPEAAAAEVPEMDQLEAELESELQKLSGQMSCRIICFGSERKAPFKAPFKAVEAERKRKEEEEALEIAAREADERKAEQARIREHKAQSLGAEPEKGPDIIQVIQCSVGKSIRIC